MARNTKVYIGRRSRSGNRTSVFIRYSDGRETTLPARLDMQDHSPTGLEWGYRGQGPNQLALALVSAEYNTLVADHYESHWEFLDSPKSDFILDGAEAVLDGIVSSLPQSGWTITGSQIRDAVQYRSNCCNAPPHGEVDVEASDSDNTYDTTRSIATGQCSACQGTESFHEQEGE